MEPAAEVGELCEVRSLEASPPFAGRVTIHIPCSSIPSSALSRWFYPFDTQAMFRDIGEYIEGELTATCADYTLLQNMTAAAGAEYDLMLAAARDVNEQMAQLRDKYIELQPQLKLIDGVAAGVDQLHATALELDAYSKRLEARFKQLEQQR